MTAEREENDQTHNRRLMDDIVPLPQRPAKPQQNNAFTTSIQALVNDLEHDPNRLRSIPYFCRRFQVKRRRLYDVINVFTAIGCASRDSVHEIRWHGRSRCPDFLKQESGRLEIHNLDKTLGEIFPPENCVSLPSLTLSFVLLFGALNMDLLDLREVSAFFSRDTGRYKSTLCKLYQVAIILGALGIIQRTENACEVRVQAPFGSELVGATITNPLAIDRLLSRPVRNADGMSRRREEYRKYMKEGSRGAGVQSE
jgi:hypothetical protein